MQAPLIPPGADVRQLETSAGRLRVLHAGRPVAGRFPTVLLHGGGTDNSAISWYRLLGPLGEEREVWAIDLPGFGGSIDAPPVGGPVALAHLVAEAMDLLGASPAFVVGVSTGGDVALNLALDHANTVAGLVLIGPGGLTPILRNPAAQFAAWSAAQLPGPLLLPLTRLANRFIDRALRAIVHDPATLPPEVVREFAREARHPRGSQGYLRYNQATLGRRGMLNDLTGSVHRIAVAALFFHGADDPMVDPAGSQRAADRMPDARLLLVGDCGHWAQLERHDLFLAEARSFLTELDR